VEDSLQILHIYGDVPEGGEHATEEQVIQYHLGGLLHLIQREWDDYAARSGLQYPTIIQEDRSLSFCTTHFHFLQLCRFKLTLEEWHGILHLEGTYGMFRAVGPVVFGQIIANVIQEEILVVRYERVLFGDIVNTTLVRPE
jgi:hypothetical protein